MHASLILAARLRIVLTRIEARELLHRRVRRNPMSLPQFIYITGRDSASRGRWAELWDITATGGAAPVHQNLLRDVFVAVRVKVSW